MKGRTSFRGKLFLLGIVPLAVAQLVTLFAVMSTVKDDVDRRAFESLRIGGNVTTEYLSSRSDQIRTSIEVLAADFGLKEVVAGGDIETIRSVLRNHSQRVAADVALLLDIDGHTIASTVMAATIHDMHLPSVAGNARGDFSRDFTITIDNDSYQAFAVPLRAPTPIGWVVVGFRIDDSVADRIFALTGLDVAVVDASTALSVAGAANIPREFLDRPETLLSSTNASGEPFVLSSKNGEYFALTTPFVSDESGIQVVLMQSLRTAMAPYEDARRGLILFTGLLLICVATAAAWVSGSIARPLRLLGDAVRQMISGEYNVCVYISSKDEIGELASSFNAMRTAIGEREEQIVHQASHDPLTNLPNRNKLITGLSAALEGNQHEKIAVLSIRLSRMNEISSTLGHRASDDLISLAARHLRLNLTKSDVLGHVGTNEFVILLPGRALEDALSSAEKIEGILGAGVTLGRINIALHTEIGIAIYPDHGKNAGDLLRNAMIARIEAQIAGETVASFEPGREAHHVRQLRIVNDLRSAIQKDELRVHFQPKLSLTTHAVSGVEALVRWQHAEYGWLTPDEFVPAAEEAGTIVHLTRHVLRQSIAACVSWQDHGFFFQVSVNVSARDLQDEYLPYYVLQLLKDHDLPANRLTLEVTENSVMQKVQKSISVLECLREIGVRISMDDFGTGHSSLAQLKNIPLHELKIDKSFVTTLLQDRQNEAIVRTTLQLARNMGLEVVAEGVEDDETLLYLKNAGCAHAQGYILSKPLPSADFLSWMSRRPETPQMDRRGPKPALRRKA